MGCYPVRFREALLKSFFWPEGSKRQSVPVGGGVFASLSSPPPSRERIVNKSSEDLFKRPSPPMDGFELLLNARFQREWVQAFFERTQFFFLGRRDESAAQDARVGRGGPTVDAVLWDALARFFAFQFHARSEKVDELPQFSARKLVDERSYFWIVVPFVAEPMPGMRPIFLFHMRVIIAAVGPAARVIDRLEPVFLAPAQHVAVDEFAAVVTVDPLPDKGLGPLHIAQLLHGGVLPPAMHGPHFHPGREDIRIVHHPQILAADRPATKGNGVHLRPAWFLFVPRTTADRDVPAQQGSWFGALAPFACFGSARPQEPIQRRWTGLQQLLSHRSGQRPVIRFISGHPVRQHGGQPLAAGLLSAQPDLLQGRQQQRSIVDRRASHNSRKSQLRHGLCRQGANRRFAMIAHELHRLVD